MNTQSTPNEVGLLHIPKIPMNFITWFTLENATIMIGMFFNLILIIMERYVLSINSDNFQVDILSKVHTIISTLIIGHFIIMLSFMSRSKTVYDYHNKLQTFAKLPTTISVVLLAIQTTLCIVVLKKVSNKEYNSGLLFMTVVNVLFMCVHYICMYFEYASYNKVFKNDPSINYTYAVDNTHSVNNNMSKYGKTDVFLEHAYRNDSENAYPVPAKTIVV